MTNRPPGRTKFRAPLLGIGDLADRVVPLSTCVDTLRRALNLGLNMVDTAPGCENRYSEPIVGSALNGRRDQLSVPSCDAGSSPALPPTSHE